MGQIFTGTRRIQRTFQKCSLLAVLVLLLYTAPSSWPIRASAEPTADRTAWHFRPFFETPWKNEIENANKKSFREDAHCFSLSTESHNFSRRVPFLEKKK